MIFNYLNKIVIEYEDILTAGRDRMLQLVNEFEAFIPHDQVSTKFADAVVAAMRYNDLRNKEFLAVLRKIKVKCCVYCHSQLTVVINKEYYKKNTPPFKKGEVKTIVGLLELDHKYPKSQYPFLCTTFYNLYPSCSHCNKAKSDTGSDFELYTDSSENLDLIHFSLDDRSVIKYLQTRKSDDIEIVATPVAGQEAIFKKYDDMFSVTEIYKTQKDIAEELIVKKEIYTKRYNKILLESFKKIFPDQSMLNRLIIGNYANPDEMHQRPMAKFVQEIAKDLDLIP